MNNRNIKVSNTNSSRHNKGFFVRIYKNGNKVAEVEMRTRDPLKALQNIVNNSKYLDDLSQQLREHLNCEANPDGELTLEDFQHLNDEHGLKVQVC